MNFLVGNLWIFLFSKKWNQGWKPYFWSNACNININMLWKVRPYIWCQPSPVCDSCPKILCIWMHKKSCCWSPGQLTRTHKRAQHQIHRRNPSLKIVIKKLNNLMTLLTSKLSQKPRHNHPNITHSLWHISLFETWRELNDT